MLGRLLRRIFSEPLDEISMYSLPAGVTLLPTAGTFTSMAYLVRYHGDELGRIERSPREDGGHWNFNGTGKYIGRHYETEEFDNAIDYALRLTVFTVLPSR